MKKMFLLAIIAVTITVSCLAQLTTTPSGGNKKAWVGEQVGLTNVEVHYDRPAVKGREGKIWGQLVHTGFADQGFGSSKSAPWRAGANENTTISFSTNVKVEGKELPAGKYGLFIAYDPTESTIIFSKNSVSWGSYYYNENEDALRVKVKPVALQNNTEWLKYEFANQTDNSATVILSWEKLSIPFNIEVDLISAQLETFRNELRNRKGFVWQTWDQAAQWAVQNNTNLEEALRWTDSATSPIFGGSNHFQPFATRAALLQKMGRSAEAETLMKKVLPIANMQELHQYGRSLLAQKKAREALEVFKLNASKNPSQFTTTMGLVRGYSANGDYKNALKFAKQALPMAPNQLNKTNVESMIRKLEQGQDVN